MPELAQQAHALPVVDGDDGRAAWMVDNLECGLIAIGQGDVFDVYRDDATAELVFYLGHDWRLMQKRWDYLIIVTGMPATGKSRFAAALQRALGFTLLAKDAIKEPLLDLLQPADAASSRRLSDLSFALLFLLAPQLPGRGLILEGNFRGEHEPQLRALQACATSSAQVLCTLDENLRRARLAARRTDPARHRGHRDGDAAVATTAAAADEYLDLPGERLGLAGDAPDFVTDALILELAHVLRRQERGA